MSDDWISDRFTGLCTRFGPLPLEPGDPSLDQHAATVPPWGPRHLETSVGGAGLTHAAALGACLGEVVERVQAYPLPDDALVEGSQRDFPLDEPTLGPDRFVLFHPEQYAQPWFPFQPADASTRLRWVCAREVASGEPRWVPEEVVFLYPQAGSAHRLAPAISTGLSAGRLGDPVVLRGLQETIERDALMGAWWERYPLEEWPAAEVTRQVPADLVARAERPNLTYRFYRVRSPFSAHVTITTCAGEGRGGFAFSAGAACRETRAASWTKSWLEAVQGHHYARYLRANAHDPDALPSDFPEHSVYYSLHPDRLADTVLAHPTAPHTDDVDTAEDLATLTAALGAERPVLARDVTPPAAARAERPWRVVKVVVPGLQPMHGNHATPHLGGALWAPRGVAEWAHVQPHPFP